MLKNLKMTALVNFTQKKIWNVVGALVGWFAVVGQLVLIIINRQTDLFETVIRFFSYFTILTNTLVALYFTSQISTIRALKFLKNNASLTAITGFILIVGLVYQIVLRSIWQPSGFQMVIDELLHTVIPMYVLVYWFMFIIFEDLKPRLLFSWLLYPLIYFIVIMFRGSFSDFYPYPFVDATSIGYTKVFGNFLVLSVIVMILLSILYLLARFFKKQ